MKILSKFSPRTILPKKVFPPTLTQQHNANDTNINSIMARARKTHQMPPAKHDAQALYGDFSEVSDYHTAINHIKNAEAQFLQLPAEIRKKFENNPQNFLNYMENPDNLEEAVELGLREPPPPDPSDTPQAPEVTPETAQASTGGTPSTAAPAVEDSSSS